jgi:hypothetical protein
VNTKDDIEIVVTTNNKSGQTESIKKRTTEKLFNYKEIEVTSEKKLEDGSVVITKSKTEQA